MLVRIRFSSFDFSADHGSGIDDEYVDIDDVIHLDDHDTSTRVGGV